MKNIRIEEVGDINYDFPYLEVFLKDAKNPFLEVAISEKRELGFKFYASNVDISLNAKEWEDILFVANDFLLRALKGENYFLNFNNQIE